MEEKEQNPLFLPKGSVRALIALSVIGTACYMGVSSGEFTMPEWLMTLLATITGFYFGNRAVK